MQENGMERKGIGIRFPVPFPQTMRMVVVSACLEWGNIMDSPHHFLYKSTITLHIHFSLKLRA